MRRFNFLEIILILFVIVLLVLIRGFEDSIFYDPLLNFFKTNYTVKSLPDMNRMLLFTNITLRYFLNAMLSVLVLWFIFKNKEIIKITFLLYFLFFVLLFSVFVFVIYTGQTGYNHTVLFYLRRFLIQPLLLLVLLPAFFYHKFKSR